MFFYSLEFDDKIFEIGIDFDNAVEDHHVANLSDDDVNDDDAENYDEMQELDLFQSIPFQTMPGELYVLIIIESQCLIL